MTVGQIDRSTAWLAGIALVAVVAIGALATVGLGGSVDFVDEVTRETTVRSVLDVPPMIGKEGGPTLVRAIYENDSAGKKLVYLQRYDEAAKNCLERWNAGKERPSPAGLTNIEEGQLVRGVGKGSAWVRADSEDGVRVITGKAQ